MPKLKQSQMPELKSEVRNIRADALEIHQEVQKYRRAYSWVKKLAEDFDFNLVGVLTAVEKTVNGKTHFLLVDGASRWEAIMLMNGGDFTCKVHLFKNASDKDAHHLFKELNAKRYIGPYEKFMNAVGARYPAETRVLGICTKAGYEVSQHSGDGKICCINAAQQLDSYDEGRTLERTLYVVTQAWGRSSSAVDGVPLKSVGAFLRSKNGTVMESRLIQKLAGHPGGASGYKGRVRGFSQVNRVSISVAGFKVTEQIYNGRGSAKA